MLNRELILQIFRQLLTTHPDLTQHFKKDQQFMFTLVARMAVFEEMRKEFAFEDEEVEQLYQSLIDKEFFETVRMDRVKRFYRNIIEAASYYSNDDEFKSQILDLVLEEIRNAKAKKTS